MALPEITQENVHLFIPFKIAKVTEMIVEAENRNWEELNKLRFFLTLENLSFLYNCK